MMTLSQLLAIDVGTLSARAGLFDGSGALIASTSAPLELHHPAENRAVYRMNEIWDAVGIASRECLLAAGRHAQTVAAVAFDATSSLYVDAPGGLPFDGTGDVVCWMDHRAEGEAAEINAGGHPFLRYVGGCMSPEMHLPKLVWLKRAQPEVFGRIVAIRDLCDELGFRATGKDVRSVCALACKWPYLPHESDPWQCNVIDDLEIAELQSVAQLHHRPRLVGCRHGTATAKAAAHLGVHVETPVAVGLIDAEAGALGVLGRGFQERMNQVLPMIGGTSTNYMPFASEPRHIPGVWGPFKDAVFRGHWMHEGGQSLSGAALDAVLAHHPASARNPSAETHMAVASAVLDTLDSQGPTFASRRHIVPDWLGNRSPLGDGQVRALATGLGPDDGPHSLLETYYATARALALQSRHVIEHLNKHGFSIDSVTLSGGHLKNPLLVHLYRDALGAKLTLSDTSEPVLLGTAMVAAVAGGLYDDLFSASDAMAPSQRILAADPQWRRAHDHAYRIYLRLFAVRNEIEASVADFEQKMRALVG